MFRRRRSEPVQVGHSAAENGRRQSHRENEQQSSPQVLSHVKRRGTIDSTSQNKETPTAHPAAVIAKAGASHACGK